MDDNNILQYGGKRGELYEVWKEYKRDEKAGIVFFEK